MSKKFILIISDKIQFLTEYPKNGCIRSNLSRFCIIPN